MLQPANVATPFDTVTGFVVQASVAPAVPVPLVIANDTCVVLSVVTMLLFASSTATFGCVGNAVPAVPLLGCCVNTSLVAWPAPTESLSLAVLLAVLGSVMPVGVATVAVFVTLLPFAAVRFA